MIHPTPPGTRDILPEEMRELRALEAALSDAFESSATARSRRRRSSTPRCCGAATSATRTRAYRFFDERGELLAMRSDMTIPIARLVATRLQDAEPPLRFSYIAQRLPSGEPAARPDAGVHPGRGGADRRAGSGGDRRGDRGPERRARRRRADPRRASASATPTSTASCWPSSGSQGEPRDRILDRLATHDLVGLEMAVDEVEGLDAEAARPCWRLPGHAGRGRGPRQRHRARRRGRRAGAQRPARDLRPARVPRASPSASGSTSACSATSATTPGAIVEVYDPALGHILGGGGRYDDLSAASAATAGGRLRALPRAAARRQTEEERQVREGER